MADCQAKPNAAIGLTAALLGCRTDALETFVTPDAVGSIGAEQAATALRDEASKLRELAASLSALADNTAALEAMEAAHQVPCVC